MDEDLPLEQILVIDFPEAGGVAAAASGCYKSLGIVFVLFGVIPFLLSIFYTNRRAPRGHSRQKACYANIRVILGALEMYNMDNSIMKTTLADSDVTDKYGILVEKQYLKTPVSRPEPNCSYSGSDLAGQGRISCAAHGTVE